MCLFHLQLVNRDSCLAVTRNSVINVCLSEFLLLSLRHASLTDGSKSLTKIQLFYPSLASVII